MRSSVRAGAARRIPAILGLLLIAIAAAVVMGVPGAIHRWLVSLGVLYPSWEHCTEVLAWVAEERLPPGADRELALPPALAGLGRDGIATSYRIPDGRTCVLVKRSIGWKENFTGTLCCDAPLAPTEIVAGSPPYADYVVLEGSVHFRELYIAERLAPGWLHVYFDLN